MSKCPSTESEPVFQLSSLARADGQWHFISRLLFPRLDQIIILLIQSAGRDCLV